MTARGGAPSDRRSRAISRPAAQLPPSRTRASGNSSAVLPRRSRTRDASDPTARRSAPATRRPVRSARRGAPQESGVARLDHAAIDEKAAITIFGETGEAVDLRDRQPRGLERLDERIGEPLAELVKRHEPVTGYCRMATAIAERQPARLMRPGQIGPNSRSRVRRFRGPSAPRVGPPNNRKGSPAAPRCRTGPG